MDRGRAARPAAGTQLRPALILAAELTALGILDLHLLFRLASCWLPQLSPRHLSS